MRKKALEKARSEPLAENIGINVPLMPETSDLVLNHSVNNPPPVPLMPNLSQLITSPIMMSHLNSNPS